MLKYTKMNISGVELRNGEIIFHDGQTEEEIQQIEEEYTWNLLRMIRDTKLSKTDWWCASDQSPTQAQLDYRQALRDLPANSTPSIDEDGNLTGVTWPTKPE